MTFSIELAARTMVGDDQRSRVPPIESLGVANAGDERGFPRPGVVARHGAIRRETQHFARRAVDVLRGVRVARVAGADVEHSIGSKKNTAAVVLLGACDAST